MAGLADVYPDLYGYLDPVGAEESAGTFEPGPAFAMRGDPSAKLKTLADVTPESQGVGSRLFHGALGDLRDLGNSIFGLGSIAMREGMKFAGDPIGRLKDYGDALAPIADHPLASAIGAAKEVGSALIEPYVPKEGESGFDVIKRNVLDHPLRTAMDVAAVVGGPAEIGARLGLPGADAVANVVSHADPISLVRSATGGILKSAAPDAITRIEANRIITQQASESAMRSQFAQRQFHAKVQDVFSGLDDAEKTMFFPYVEGRLKAMGPESGMAGQMAELSPATGQWTPRAIDPARVARLEAARQAYMPILDEFETISGYKPEIAALEAGKAETRQILAEGGDPLHPDSVQRIQQAAADMQQKAEAAALSRRTVSTRTALDARKAQDFQAQIEAIRQREGEAAAMDFANRYPPEPTSPEEALSVMGPQGGVYFPHSGEVFTRQQSTIGGLLTKVRESVPWKQNAGSLLRTGALDTMDPEKALMRTFVALNHGAGLYDAAAAVGEQLGERLPAGYRYALDPDLRAGTHQLLHPALMHQEGALTESLQELTQRLLAHGDDPAVRDLNLLDVAKAASDRMAETFPLRKDSPIYKIPKGAGDALAAFRKSFEPPSNFFAQWLDRTADPFNFVTLNLRPARVLNNAIGNTIFQVMQGIHPFSTTGIGAISDMAGAMASKLGLTGSERAAQLARVYDLPGVATGGMTGALRETRTGAFLESGGLGAPGRLVGGAASKFADFNANVESTARALSMLFEIRKDAPSFWSRALGSAKDVMDTGDAVERYANMGVKALDDAGYRAKLDKVNQFLNDYNRATPTERTMWRRIFPYEKFYRHALNLAITAPFTDPTRTTMLRGLGKAALNDAQEKLGEWGFDWHSMVPPSMQNSIPVDFHDDPQRGRQVRMLNTQGPNPFSVLSGADPGAQSLGALHPLVKTAIELATGVNLYTMDRFQDPTTTYSGKQIGPSGALVDSTVRPGPISLFARQFFPVQIARDFVAAGRTPLDSASLLDMVRASVTGHEGEAFRTDKRGVAERRPTANALLRAIVPVPQTLEMPTAEQDRATLAEISDAYDRLGRNFPALRQKMMDTYRRHLNEATGPRRTLPYRKE